LKTVRALQRLDGLAVTIVLGRGYAHRERLMKSAKRFKGALRVVVDAQDLPGLLAKHDLAITSGGITTYEACCVGTPALVLAHSHNTGVKDGKVIYHELENAKYMQRQGMALNLGLGKSTSIVKLRSAIISVVNNWSLRERLRKNALRTVDGKGLERVSRIVEELIS
jgi:spore coat polysaccharide biosynthesis predicted glycosyltransferase SpsG